MFVFQCLLPHVILFSSSIRSLTFFFTSEYITYIHYIFISHSSADGLLGWFHFLATVKRASGNGCVSISTVEHWVLWACAQEWNAGSSASPAWEMLTRISTMIAPPTVPPAVKHPSLLRPLLTSTFYRWCSWWQPSDWSEIGASE